MKTTKLLASIALLLAANNGFAATSPLVGTWLLEKSENPMPDGSVVSYCTGVHGLIIYTEDGYVSVALNCAAKGNGKEPADVSGRKFFYAGTYQYDGTRVTHKILNSSQPELIGENISRDVSLKGTQLILTGLNQGQSFSAYWRKSLTSPRCITSEEYNNQVKILPSAVLERDLPNLPWGWEWRYEVFYEEPQYPTYRWMSHPDGTNLKFCDSNSTHLGQASPKTNGVHQ
jgi:hypothetical protein